MCLGCRGARKHEATHAPKLVRNSYDLRADRLRVRGSNWMGCTGRSDARRGAAVSSLLCACAKRRMLMLMLVA